MSPTDHQDPVADLLREVRGLIAYHHSLGIRQLRRTPALERFLRGLGQQPATKPLFSPGSSDTAASLKKGTGPIQEVAAAPAVSMADLRAAMADCRLCPLHQDRRRVVLGRGRQSAPLLLLVGDSPTEEDERSGAAFSGEAGELLARMLAAIKLDSAEVFVTNLIKCRPPDNRPPTPEEIASCLPYLLREIEAAAPRIICAMGPLATRYLLRTEESFYRLRGRFLDLPGRGGATIAVMPTFHPALLIKDPDLKKGSWQDLQLIARKLTKA